MAHVVRQPRQDSLARQPQAADDVNLRINGKRAAVNSFERVDDSAKHVPGAESGMAESPTQAL